MPELPDVEVYRRYLNATALHQPIERTHVEDARLLVGTTPQGLGRALKGRSFESSCRHGKYLFAALDRGGWLVLHFGMTGRLAYFRNPEHEPDYTRCTVTFRNEFRLAYVARRKLGHITLADSPGSFVRERNLGPDALSLSARDLCHLASGRRGYAKSWLMDQHAMAGIGNVYSDEILFQAAIHPRCPVPDLDEQALERLHRALRHVLETAIEAKADPGRMPRHFLLPHRHTGGRCPHCGRLVTHLQAAGRRPPATGRRAWYCPACQSGC